MVEIPCDGLGKLGIAWVPHFVRDDNLDIFVTSAEAL